MRAGSLKHRVVFQEQKSTKNNYGEKVDEWVDTLTAPVGIRTISGKEQYLSNQNYSTLSHLLEARYSSLINTKQRILFGTRIFNILAVLNVYEANKRLEILVEEVVS
jgi:SPP1 family predicted phage head-tail adaptor